jgi:beta-lactamase superfamily II metal-dependent hydrolase
MAGTTEQQAEQVVVRMYTVRFGDAILVTVPDRDPSTGVTTTRRILIDVGNAPRVAGSGEGGDDTVFEAVVGDILDQLDGNPLDLYVMTHEHLDHVQGLFYTSTKVPALDLAHRLTVDHVWLTASAAPDYHDRFPEAATQKALHAEMYRRLAALAAADASALPDTLHRMLLNNNPGRTSQCVDFLRTLNPAQTHYVHRGVPMDGIHPFREANLSIWAPEEDTTVYRGRFVPLDEGAVPSPDGSEGGSPRTPKPADPLPPPGVDVGAFRGLVEARRSGIVDNLMEIDKAANNTSVVFALEWRGWRLLFPGDAEIRSWRTMESKGVLEPVHLLKVAHHGSHNGTPTDDIFDAILPETPPDDRPRHAVISTWGDTYSGIPDTPTNTRLAGRATLQSTLDHPDDLFYEVTFPG